MKIIVGGIIEKNGKILLVQEAKEKCYGKWNLPAGRLEKDEILTDGAIREIKEETGCDIGLTGIVNIDYGFIDGELFMSFIFLTKLLNENIKFNKEEILDVKWYEIDEVINNMKDELRDTKFIKNTLINLKNNNIAPINILNEF